MERYTKHHKSTQMNSNYLVRIWHMWENLVGKALSPFFAEKADTQQIRQEPFVEGNNASFFHKRKFLLLSSLILIILASLAYLLYTYSGEVNAAWYNDNWQYRQRVTFVNNGAAVTAARKVKLDIDTATLITAGTLQSDCDDLRFTDVNGKLLEYYLDSGGGACNTASTDVYILVASVPTGTNTTYMYYGNPSAPEGTVSSQFAESTYTPDSGPTFGSEEVSEGPVAYWKLDTGAGGTAQDTTESANNLTITNASWRLEDFCKAGKCIEFDGDGDYLTRADDSDFDFAASDDFTINGWFRHGTQTSGQDVIIAKTNASGGYKVLMESDGDLTFAIDDDATWSPDDSATSTAATYDDNQWHHFAAVKDGTTSITLYVDGVQVAQDSSIAATGTLANSAALYIGVDGDGASNDWDGFLDDIKVYRYARTAAQVKQDATHAGSASGVGAVLGTSTVDTLSDGLVTYWKMDEESANGCSGGEDSCDSSGNVFHGTWTGTTAITDGKYGNGLTFDGNSDYVSDVVNNVSSYPFSMSVWMKGNGTSDNIIAFTNTGNTTQYFWIEIDGSGFAEIGARNSSSYSTSGTTTINDDEWHHIVGVWTASEIRIYVDGYLEGTTSNSASFAAGVDTFVSGVLRTSSPSNYFAGEVDEARLYSKELSTQDVQALYAHTPGPNVYYDLEHTDTSENLDQENNTGGSAILSGTDEYQSFTAGASGDLTKFAWYNPTGSDCDATVHLREGTGTGGTSIANEAIEQRNSGWEEFTFTTPASVTSSSTYSLHFDIDTCHIGDESSSNPYSGGRNSNGASNDYRFRTYVEETGLADLSGNGNLASINNFSGTYEVKGKYGFAYDFDGSDDSLAVSSGSDNDMDFNDTEGFSGSAWVKVDTMPGSSNQDAIIAKWDETSTLRGYRLVVENDDADSTGNFQVEVYDESANQAITASGSNDTVNEDEWYYVHFTFNGGTSGTAGDLKLYTNALLTDSNAANGSFLGLEDIAADFTVGNYDATDVVANNTPFDGIIDDVKIFGFESPTRNIITAYNDNHPLGGSPIASQVGYWSLDEQQGQNVYDRGYGENTGVLGASSTASTDDPAWKTQTDCKVNGCADFDGGDFTSLADTDDLDFSAADLSVSAWVYHDTVSGTDTIIDKRNSTSEGYHLTNASGTWTFVVEEVTSGDHCTVTSTTEGSTTAEWIHVAANYDASAGTCKLYINGTLVADTTSSSNPTNIDAANSQSFRIGSDDGSTNFWDGKIDEVKIYAADLTQDEILVDMNAGAALNFGSSADSEATLLSDGAGNPPIAEWRFDEGTDNTCTDGVDDVCDVSGSGYDGDFSGSPVWTNAAQCPYGKCLEFNGTTDYITTQDINEIDGATNLSLSVWVKVTDLTDDGVIMAKDVHGGSSQLLFWRDEAGVSRNDTFAILVTDALSNSARVEGADGIANDNEWHHLVVTYEGGSSTGLRMYVDGIEDPNSGVSTTSVTSLKSNASSLMIGRPVATPSKEFTGFIDDVKIYDYTLTETQAKYLYNRGRPVAHWRLDECTGDTVYSVPSSPTAKTTDSALDGTITIGASGSNDAIGSCDSGDSTEAWNNGTTGKFGSSVDFDGTDDYAQVTDPDLLDGLSEITISAWINVDTVSGSQFITTKNNNNANERAFQFYVNGSELQGRVCGTGSGDCVDLATSGAGLTTDRWYHATYVYTSSGPRIYIDGNRVATSGSTISSAMDANTEDLYIGCSINTATRANYFNGQIDDLRIYNYALSANQIKQVYNNGSSVSFGQ